MFALVADGSARMFALLDDQKGIKVECKSVLVIRNALGVCGCLKTGSGVEEIALLDATGGDCEMGTTFIPFWETCEGDFSV